MNFGSFRSAPRKIVCRLYRNSDVSQNKVVSKAI